MGAPVVRVESSAIDAVAYDPRRCELLVEYKGGRGYVYLDVPRETYDALLAAPSKGKFVNAEVKPRYRYREA